MRHTKFATVKHTKHPYSLYIRLHGSHTETANCCRLASTGIDTAYRVFPVIEISDKDYPKIVERAA